MNPEFPVSDIELRKVKTTRSVLLPIYSNSTWQLNQHEFAMQVEGVASFYVCNGREVEFAPAEGATRESIELYLNGSVYGAILHQRNILPLHGSSFVSNGQGIILCGGSGAGKSSLTAAFCMNGAEFLTDDVTPVVFPGGKPGIMPLSDRIKLWGDSLQQLNQNKSNLTAIHPGEDKFYFPMKKSRQLSYPLHRILIIEPAELPTVEINLLTGIDSFTALRNEVYRWEYLVAMPDTETGYLEKLLTISRLITVTKVKRPAAMPIETMRIFLSNYIDKGA